MTVYYIDHEGGNNSNDGLTFATRKKSLKAAISSSGSHEYRVIETAGGLVSSNTTWCSSANMPSRNIQGATNLNSPGNNVGYQINMSNHGFQPGDYLYFYAFNTAEINGWWEVTSVVDINNFIIPCYVNTQTTLRSSKWVWDVSNHLVKLDTPKTKNLVNGFFGSTPETGIQTIDSWTASSNVVVTQYSYTSISNDTPTQARTLDINWYSGFTTGKLAYYTFPAGLDLSDYRQLSFYVFQVSGNTTSAPHVKLCLCSDTAGNNVEYEFPLPALGSTYTWFPLTIDCSNLADGLTMTVPIQSIALYVTTDRSSCRLRFQHIIACKDNNAPDCLTHTSLVSTKREGDIWYPVWLVDEERVLIGTHNAEVTSTMTSYSSTSARTQGYWYNTFEPTTYEQSRYEKLRETGLPMYVYNPINTYAAARAYDRLPSSSSDTYGEYIQNRDNFTISGGWNRTDMSTREPGALSWLWAPNAKGNSLYLKSTQNFHLENMGFAGGEYSCYMYGATQFGRITNCSHAGGKTGFRGYYEVNGVRFENISTVGSWRGIDMNYLTSGFTVKNWTDRSRLNALTMYVAAGWMGQNCDIRNSTTGATSIQTSSGHLHFSGGNFLGLGYAFYSNSRYNNCNYNGVRIKSIKYLTRTTTSATYPSTHGIYFHGLDQSLLSTYSSSNYYFVPDYTTSSGPFSWTKRSNVGYNGNNEPLYRFGYSDGTYAAASGGVAYQTGRDTHTGAGSMEISWIGGGSRQRDNYDIQVTNRSLNQYARGRHVKCLIAEVSVAAGGTVSFSVQAKRTAAANDNPYNHVQGNIYVGSECGNAEARSANCTLWDEWEELTVDVTPVRAGVMKFYFEIKGYYSNYRYIQIDSIGCTQS